MNVCHRRRETKASEVEAGTPGWLWGQGEGLDAETYKHPTERALWALRTGVPKSGTPPRCPSPNPNPNPPST